MMVIDGSQGEGGGQILRTTLSMAMITGTSVRVENIRAGRRKPGLMRQHLACVKAAQVVSNAEVSGAEVGSTVITFIPKGIKAGNYHFAVGTAGSTILVFQTVLSALALAENESILTFEGGTHNLYAPSFDFIELAYLPILRKMGFDVEITLHKHGFYPQGGGYWTAVIKPTFRMECLELLESGDLVSKEAIITSANIPEHVITRELDEIIKRCNWPTQNLKTITVGAIGSGNIVSMRLQYENCMEVIECVGKIGISAEKVAQNAAKGVRRYLSANVPVGEHLADQLLLPMIFSESGMFSTVKPSSHTRTNIDVIHLFTDKRFKFIEITKDRWKIQLG